MVADGRTVGWLYGAVHYGTPEQASLSPAAVRAMAQTRHVYLERTDRVGAAWPMRYANAEDLEVAVRAKRQAAAVAAHDIRQGLIAAKKIERDSDGVEVTLSQDPAYHQHWALANNYCGAFYEYGTELLVRAFATGKGITIHALETEASLRAALERSRAGECQGANASPLPDVPVPERLEAICVAIRRDISLDQLEGRAYRPTGATACALDSRHRTMAAKIAAAWRAGEKPFVTVGRGHLMPGETLIPLLVEQGLTLHRID